MSQSDSQPILTITSTSTTHGSKGSFTIYQIELLSKESKWINNYRYSEIRQLDSKLKRNFTFMKSRLPRFPEKKLMGSMDPEFIERRRKGLEAYLSAIVSNYTLGESEEVTNFLKKPESRISSSRRPMSSPAIRRKGTELTLEALRQGGAISAPRQKAEATLRRAATARGFGRDHAFVAGTSSRGLIGPEDLVCKETDDVISLREKISKLTTDPYAGVSLLPQFRDDVHLANKYKTKSTDPKILEWQQAILVASCGGKVDAVEGLLQQLDGSDLALLVSSTDDHGRSCLHLACLHGHPELVKLLLAFGADPLVLDEDGCNPLHCAARSGSTATLLAILSSLSGREPCTKTISTGETALIIFSRHAEEGDAQVNEAVQLLINGGCMVGEANDEGVTALHNAAWKGNETLVRLLVSSGSPVDPIEHKRKETPLHWASRMAHQHVANCLISLKADVNLVGAQGTALDLIILRRKVRKSKQALEEALERMRGAAEEFD